MSFHVVAIVGGRDFGNVELMQRTIMSLKTKHGDLAVVSGTARGADIMARTEARSQHVQIIDVPAMWSELGKSAGFYRNALIVQLADEVVAFWDGESRGTKNTIDVARAEGKPVRVISY